MTEKPQRFGGRKCPGRLEVSGKLYEGGGSRAEPQRVRIVFVFQKWLATVVFSCFLIFGFVFHPFRPTAESKLQQVIPILEDKALFLSVSYVSLFIS